ncbi:MAG: carbon-nitrogen hydrolase [Pseudohongiella sp.]|nr:carbon-nitrogen hydrolase [Pseudohongiella sp.]
MKKPDPNRLDNPKNRLTIRNAILADAAAVAVMTAKAYAGTGIMPYVEAMITGHINRFPQGQFVATVNDQVVGYCGTFRIAEKIALAKHTWGGISGNGYASRHDGNGDWLYGMELSVDKDYRGYRIGQRFYAKRKGLCRSLGLKGIVVGGRLPNLKKHLKHVETAENYIEEVQQRHIKDPVLSVQLRNGFEVIGLLPDYIDEDQQSLGYASHLVWYNPRIPDPEIEGNRIGKNYGLKATDSVRVATVQYLQRRVSSFEEFIANVRYFVDVMANYKADFVMFPELFSLQLLTIADKELSASEAVSVLTEYTPQFIEAMRDLALRYNVNIIGGSHPIYVTEDKVENVAFVFLRDGSVHKQSKIHPTPSEATWWNIEGGNEVKVIDTDCGPIGVLICYDSEFPELARHLTDQGAHILFVPFCTDERQGYQRVRYCCQARAIENQIYVVMSGNVGNLPNVANMDIQYAQSCILTPCDFAFARDGIAADTTPNVETVAIADLRIDSLIVARNSGTVQNLKDRRHDLYQLKWIGKKQK